jgi:hypothetical protein
MFHFSSFHQFGKKYYRGSLAQLLRKRQASNLTYLERCTVLRWLGVDCKNGPDVDEREAMAFGGNNLTVLMLAVKGGHLFVVKRLLEVGAEPNTTNILGETALIMACTKLKCPYMTSTQVRRRRNIVLTILQDSHIRLNKTDLDGRSALTIAAARGDEIVVQALVAAGAKLLSSECLLYRTDTFPIAAARINGHFSIAEWLAPVEEQERINQIQAQRQHALEQIEITKQKRNQAVPQLTPTEIREQNKRLRKERAEQQRNTKTSQKEKTDFQLSPTFQRILKMKPGRPKTRAKHDTGTATVTSNSSDEEVKRVWIKASQTADYIENEVGDSEQVAKWVIGSKVDLAALAKLKKPDVELSAKQKASMKLSKLSETDKCRFVNLRLSSDGSSCGSSSADSGGSGSSGGRVVKVIPASAEFPDSPQKWQTALHSIKIKPSPKSTLKFTAPRTEDMQAIARLRAAEGSMAHRPGYVCEQRVSDWVG